MLGVWSENLRFSIDPGGTFTDAYAEIPGETEGRVMKTTVCQPFQLSTLPIVNPSNYDDAPVEGIRRIIEEYTREKISRSSKIRTDKIEWIGMGTTVATNALLKRKGARIDLCVTEGFRNLLQIGNQGRPNIFSNSPVSKPSNTYEAGLRLKKEWNLFSTLMRVPSWHLCQRSFGRASESCKAVKGRIFKAFAERVIGERGYAV